MKTSETIYDETMKKVVAATTLEKKAKLLEEGLAEMDKINAADDFDYALQTTLTRVNRRRGIPIEEA